MSKNFFWSFGPQFGLKIDGGGGPSPRSATVTVLLYNISSIISYSSFNIVYCSYKETGKYFFNQV